MMQTTSTTGSSRARGGCVDHVELPARGLRADHDPHPAGLPADPRPGAVHRGRGRRSAPEPSPRAPGSRRSRPGCRCAPATGSGSMRRPGPGPGRHPREHGSLPQLGTVPGDGAGRPPRPTAWAGVRAARHRRRLGAGRRWRRLRRRVPGCLPARPRRWGPASRTRRSRKKPKKGAKGAVSKVKFISTHLRGRRSSARWTAPRRRPAVSPAKYRCLKPGKHTFTVAATNQLGQRDPTPARVKFSVSANRRGC